MKQKLLSFFLVCITLIGAAYAQERRISGKVTDDKGLALPGVSVIANGTATGTQTDDGGNYSLSVPAGTESITYRYIGFVAQTIVITSRTTINVQLQPDAAQLSEVVVTGYGSQKRTEVTGAVASIKGESVQNVAIPSIDKFFQGQVAGVQAANPSGILGQPARIRIRGTNSINSGSDPLYVVDGVPYITGDQGAVMINNPLGDINPNDIANIEVLKDGAATAIYGSRAANGVVLITTKSGQSGAAKINYDSWFAAAKTAKRYDLMNAEQFMQITNEKIKNVYPDEEDYALPMDNPTGGIYDTDWQDEIFRTGFQQSHALSLSGGSEKTTYFVSLGFADMAGIVDKNDLRRYNARAKVDQKAFNDRLTVGVNMAITHTENRGLNTNTNALSGNVGAAIYAFPNVPVKNPDGSYNISPDRKALGQGNNLLPLYGNYTNQRWVLDHNIYKSTLLNFTGNTYADLEIVKGLNAKTQIGINLLNGEDYMYWAPGHGDGDGVNGRIYQYSLPTFRYNWQNTLSYNRTFGDHSISAVIGQELQKTRTRFFFGHGTNLSSPYFGENENIISGSLTNQFIGGSANERAFESYFARANYSYKERYMLSATIRHDKISSLPWGNQGATLPGGSLGWRVSQEDFFNSDIVNELKIRGGYAKVGNTEIGNYPYAGVFAATQYGDFNGIRYNQISNSDLEFETSGKVNIGLDLGLWQDRIRFTADYFKNDINNLILAVPVSPSLGVPGNSINQNVGSMYNRGWEFTVNTVNISKENFSWTTSLNATFIKNEVTELVDGKPIDYAFHTNRVGESLGSFFGYQYHGVNPVNGNPIYEKADGSLVQQMVGQTTYRVYDPNNPDDVSQAAAALGYNDKRILGQSMPKWYGGFNNTLTYKNLDLNIFLTFSGGNKVYNRTRQDLLNNQNFANAGTELLDRWTAEGQITDVPKVAYGYGAYINQEGSAVSRFLENGNFLRAQNIALGYTFPKNLTDRINLRSLRIYAQVQNAFVITSYTGVDPEVSQNLSTASVTESNIDANTRIGLDYTTNPVPRTFTFGLNVGF